MKPFALLLGLLASRVAGAVVERALDKTAPGPPQFYKQREVSGPRVVAENAVRAAIFAAVSTAVNRYAMFAFEHFTGVWPGARPPKPGKKPKAIKVKTKIKFK